MKPNTRMSVNLKKKKKNLPNKKSLPPSPLCLARERQVHNEQLWRVVVFSFVLDIVIFCCCCIFFFS